MEQPGPQYITLKANAELFYVERKGRESSRDIFFDRPGDALLWALFEYPDIVPVLKSTERSFSDFYKSTLGTVSKEFKFPLKDSFVMVNFRHKAGPLKIQANPKSTDEDFILAAREQRQLISLYTASAKTPLMSANFVVSEQIQMLGAMIPQVDLDKSFMNLLRLYDDILTGRQISPIVNMSAARFADNSILSHVFTYDINWETVWLQFLTARALTDNLKRITAHFDSLMNSKDHIKTIIAGGYVPGYDDCIPGLRGPYNPDWSSCFMDSTLMAMFGFKNSPYYENMVLKKVVANNDTICSDNVLDDLRIRQDIQANLIFDVNSLMEGKIMECSKLRQALGRMCTKGGLLRDLSVGIQDPHELYTRLVNAIGYFPITYRETSYRASSPEGADEYQANSIILPQTNLPALDINDEVVDRISWPWSWTGDYNNVGSGDKFTWRKVTIDIMKADCIVVQLLRRYSQSDIALKMAQEQSSFGGGFGFGGATGFGFGSTTGFGQSIEGEELLSLFGEEQPVVQESKPSKQIDLRDSPSSKEMEDDSTIKPTRIKVDHQFNIQGTIYTLRAAVYSPTNKHYATLLKCGNIWFLYDDLKSRGQIVAQAPLEDDYVNDMIETRAVLFFYYPEFPEFAAAKIGQMGELVGGLSQAFTQQLTKK